HPATGYEAVRQGPAADEAVQRAYTELSAGAARLPATAIFRSLFSMPSMHEPAPAAHGAAHLDRRMDCVRRPAGRFLSVFLDRATDEGRCPGLLHLPHAGRVSYR